MFTQRFIQAQIKENIRVPRHWPLGGEFTGTSEYPAQRASNAEHVSIGWRHHVTFPLGRQRLQILCNPAYERVNSRATFHKTKKKKLFIEAIDWDNCSFQQNQQPPFGHLAPLIKTIFLFPATHEKEGGGTSVIDKYHVIREKAHLMILPTCFSSTCLIGNHFSSSEVSTDWHNLGVTCHICELWHDDVIKWIHFPRYWPFVRGIHRSTVNSPLKGQWRGALMFSLICGWINGWVNNREAGDLRRYRSHYDVTVMHSFSVRTWRY